MKRYLFIVTGIFFVFPSFLRAQTEIDALRYSQNFITGTSRSVGLGGAIGAIGGDFTGLSINPASIGLYRSSEFSISTAFYWDNTTADYLGNRITDDNFNFNLGNLGMVFYNSLGNETGWISTNFGIGYNRLNNFNQNIFMSGTNNNSSLLDNFVSFAGDQEPSSLNSFYEGLAWETYMIDRYEDTGEYFNDFNLDGYGQDQSREIRTNGFMGEYTFSFGANYNHRLYMGATIGIQRVRFDQTIITNEDDPDDIILFTDGFTFEEYLSTRGTGYNLKIGAIARPLDFLRIGAAFHTPTFYNLNDEFETYMEGRVDPEEELGGIYNASSGLNRYDYRLRTPLKIVGNAVITLGKVGLISFDYEYMDYSTADLDASDYNFFDENSTIEELYDVAHNIRVGGEVRLGPAYFRGGYAFYGSPFVTEEPNVNSNRRIISGGLGIRSSNVFFDLSYSHSIDEQSYYLYIPPVSNPAKLSSNMNSIQMTVGLRF